MTLEELRQSQLFKSGEMKKPRLALNCVGGKSALEIMRHLQNEGTVVTYGGMSREPVTVPTSALIFKDIKACPSAKGIEFVRKLDTCVVLGERILDDSLDQKALQQRGSIRNVRRADRDDDQQGTAGAVVPDDQVW